MKTFLIAPVRGLSADTHAGIVADLEARGFDVHWPARDTKQDDPVGLYICEQNRLALLRADCVHVIWDGKSQGCLFDLGMAFAAHKPIHVISLPDATEGKSFQNMLRAWAGA